MSRRIFISHSSDDHVLARELVLSLEAAGLSCWIAPRDIEPGSPYAASIVEAIRSADVMVLLLTSASSASAQVQRELERAAGYGLRIIPLRVEDVQVGVEIEYFVSSPQWVDYREEHRASGLGRLIASLRPTGAPSPEAASARPVPGSLGSMARSLVARASAPLLDESFGQLVPEEPPRGVELIGRLAEVAATASAMARSRLIVIAGLAGDG